jgi:hypothetical protein
MELCSWARAGAKVESPRMQAVELSTSRASQSVMTWIEE